MELLFYFLKVSAGLLLLYGIYWCFLRQHTYFVANRFYLLAALFLSLAAPLLEIPETAPEPVNLPTASIDLGEMSAVAVQESETMTAPDVLLLMYAIGFIFMLIRLGKRLGKLLLLIATHQRQTVGNYVLVSVEDAQIGSFSFFNYLIMNQQDQATHHDVILRHEAVHIRQRHSLDLLLVETLHVFLWFNPILILYKRSLQETHEFIADDLATAGNRLEYARELVGYSFGVPPQALVNPFLNSSQLKNRIVMLTKNRSSRWVLSRYLLALPVVVALVLLVAARTVKTPTNNNTEKITVRGHVYDKATKQPMPGASVVLLNGNAGTNADVNGTFMIQVERGQKLVVTFVGYEEEIISTENWKSGGFVEVSLEAKKNELPSLVVVSANQDPMVSEPMPPTSQNQKDSVLVTVEQSPEFPGGTSALMQFLARNLKYPATAARANVQGKVFVQFVVDKNGEIGSIRVIKGVGFGCDEETVRVVSIMPKWNPGQQNGRPVAVQYNLPIEFMLENKKSANNASLPNPPPPPASGKDDEVLQVVQQQPTFPGGNSALMRFINSNIRYPAAARRANVQGMVFMTFVVGKDGQVQNASVLKGIGFGCDEEALRIMSAMPKWNPGKHKGKLVAVKYNLPIKFVLNGKSEKWAGLDNEPEPRNIRIFGNYERINNTPTKILITDRNGTIPADKQPLIIIDGVETKTDMNSLNPDEIERIEIFKNESAKSYGEKGKNGVVVITTKQKAKE